jgi:hypothetical protein
MNEDSERKSLHSNRSELSKSAFIQSIISANKNKKFIKDKVMIEFVKLEVNSKDEDDKIKELVTEEIREASPNDFGYFTLFHTGAENKIENKKEYLKVDNMVEHLNELKMNGQRIFSNKIDVILHFAREENNSYSDLLLVDVNELKEKQNKTRGLTSKTITKKETMFENGGEELIKNTHNSYIYEKQMKMLDEDKLNSALEINKDYKNVKEIYEIQLVKKLIQKYEKVKNLQLEGDYSQRLSHMSVYEELKKSSEKIIEDYEEASNKYYGKSLRLKNKEYNNKIKKNLYKFMESIIIKTKETEQKVSNIQKSLSFLNWKQKICELVNIWDLFNCNGIDVKFSFKYLILYKFFNLRSQSKQTGKKFLESIENKIIKSIKVKESYPIMSFSENEFARLVLDIIISILLLYSLFTVPYRLFLEADTPMFILLEKFVDMYFYIDIMLNFRTSYKDKYNNDIYDVGKIMNRYFTGMFLIDFISSIPWSILFLDYIKLSYAIKVIIHVTKILRVIRLIPILNKLEQIKGLANYIRMSKLLLIYCLLIHWMGCALYYFLIYSILFDQGSETCYITNFDHSKKNMTSLCAYIFMFFQASYIIPGQYSQYAVSASQLVPAKEYLCLIIEYLLGQGISAYIFGGMTNIIQNLDQGKNFFTEKTDLLREHMLFYEINGYIQNDIRVYYDYLWQRHKDHIYGKSHFSLLSKSLRERFELLNLKTNEIFLAKFYKLGNYKLIGDILMNLKKIVLFPYEILYEEGGVAPGIYIVLNGDIKLENKLISNIGLESFSVSYSEVMSKYETNKKEKGSSLHEELGEKYCKIFPLMAAFIKTGRTYRRCYSTDFTDLLFLTLQSFDELISCFPIAMHSLKLEIMQESENNKLLENKDVFEMISRHSCRSIGSYYESSYDKLNIWIPIPIPISQIKLSQNYVESFVSKVRRQWRDIIITGDLNICLRSILIIDIIKSVKGLENSKKNEIVKKVAQSNDPLDQLKIISNNLEELVNELMIL